MLFLREIVIWGFQLGKCYGCARVIGLLNFNLDSLCLCVCEGVELGLSGFAFKIAAFRFKLEGFF